MSQAQVPEIILYHYTFSPYAKRIVWYLNLRNIPYTQCLQPVTLPRPNIKALGTSYRRIPLVSIGRDIYNDTRLILQKLTQLFPPSSSHPAISNASTAGLEALFEIWAVDGGGFRTAGALIPSSMPLIQDKKFQKDREDYTGTQWTPEKMDQGRGEALVEIRRSFGMMEHRFFADGRTWVAGGDEGPTLADIEAGWLFSWLNGLPGALPDDFKTLFPKTFAWTARLEKLMKEKADKLGKPKTVKWPEAREIVKGSGWAEEEELVVEEKDPSKLKRGIVVEVWPTDSGFNHRDKGPLVGLTGTEVVVESQMEDGTKVRVHAPRHGFRVKGHSKL